ncbi:hypothetical protein RTM1035_16402 [Roseovarius sp. TM1035]|nr:hypothetical protein RTM1035_16402 [Roseovarius sp. TM1035]
MAGIATVSPSAVVAISAFNEVLMSFSLLDASFLVQRETVLAVFVLWSWLKC